MGCNEIRDSFSEYIDGYLPKTEAKAVKAHISECAACRRELKKLTFAVQALQSLPELKAPAGFMAKVADRIERENAVWWKKALAFIDRGLEAVPLRALSAAAALALVISVMVANYAQHKPEANLAVYHPGNTDKSPSMLASATEPMPVELASTNSKPSTSRSMYFNSPNELVMHILKSDPSFSGNPIYPHPRGNGALVHTQAFLYEVVMDPIEFPMIQANIEQQGGAVPSTLREATMMYPISVRQHPSPLAPLPSEK